MSSSTETMKVLCHPDRLKIVKVLGTGEKNVAAIQKQIKTSQSATSQHLAMMKIKGLVNSRTVRVERYYSLNVSKVEALIKELSKSIGQEK